LRHQQGRSFKASVLILLLGTLIATALYYHLSLSPKHDPRIDYYAARLSAPGITPLTEILTPGPLIITFVPQLNQARQQGFESDTPRAGIAPIDAVGHEISQGIALTPAIPGKWRWESENRLSFTPAHDWPADQRYAVAFQPTLFRPGVRLTEAAFAFQTHPFTAILKETDYFVHPENPKEKKVVATLEFSHPVSSEAISQHLHVNRRTHDPSGAPQTSPLRFELIPDLHQRRYFLHSATVSPTRDEQYVDIFLDAGLRTLNDHTPSRDAQRESILIPSVTTFFQVQQAETLIVEDETATPRQTLLFHLTDRVQDEAFAQKVELFLLPEEVSRFIPHQHRWNHPSEITPEVLTQSQKIVPTLTPTENGHAPLHSLRIDVPEQRQLLVRINPGLISWSGYELAESWQTLLTAPDYPKSLKIVSEGSLLSLAGEKQVPVVAQGLKAIEFEIARVLPQHLQHLISQTRGDINRPDFINYHFDKKNISEISKRILPLAATHPAQPNYTALDLSPELASVQKNRLGLFLLEAHGWDPVLKRRLYDHDAKDQRLILVTDMGLLLKTDRNREHDLFVQSISSGAPVADATLILLGKNGLPLLKRTTSAQGHAHFPSAQSWINENEPVAFLAIKGDDFSFIPYQKPTRQINLSRFDTGGLYQWGSDQDQVNAYLFSDRGIYRPGETVQLAAVVKRPDFKPLPGFPVNWVIKNPQGITLLEHRMALETFGLIELPFATDATSPTGHYTADLYLPEKHRRGRLLGSTSFKVEEFQPDSLRINSRFVPTPASGWSTLKQVEARVSLHNLFGTPAQNRKVTAQLQLTPTQFTFSAFPGYRFADPQADIAHAPRSATTQLPDTRTDEQGEAVFEIDLQRYDQGVWQLGLTTEGFEPGEGRSVSARSQMLISPYPALIGDKADGDLAYLSRGSERHIHYLHITPDLKSTAKSNLTLSLIQEQPLSTLVKQPNGTWRYQTIKKRHSISETPFSIAENGTDYRLKTDSPGDFLVEIRDDAGTLMNRISYTVAGKANLQGQLERNAELELKLARSDYAPGDTIEMNIVAPYTGAGLISIETDRVHHFKWFRSETERSVQTITVPEGIEGNAYVSVAFVRSFHSPEIFTSPLSYAVAPFSIDRSSRTLLIQLDTPDRIRPGQPFSLGYQSSHASKMVLFAINEGILQVARYQTPNPLDHFMQKRALQVETQQMLDLILPDFSRVREWSATGGDADFAAEALGRNLNPFARRLDQPAIWWSGIIDADPTRRSQEVTLPDSFNGEVRIMAVAVNDRAIGSAHRRVPVRGDFIITPNLPLAVSPTDRFTITAGIANAIEGAPSDSPHTVQVELTSSEHLQVENPRQTLTLQPGSEATVTFDILTQSRPGAAELRFQVTSTHHTAQRTVSLSVRPASAFSTTVESGRLNPGTHTLEFPRTLYPHFASQRFSVSDNPMVLTQGLMAWLKDYPHHCTEQILSATYPLLALMPTLPTAKDQRDARTRLHALISNLRGRQLSDGSFGLWPGSATGTESVSLYALNFLTDARAEGLVIPSEMLDQGNRFLKRIAARPTTTLDQALQRAWAIYLLTRQGEVTTNYLTHLQESLKQSFPDQWQAHLTATYLAATWKLLQQPDEAERLIQQYRPSAPSPEGNDFDSRLANTARQIVLLGKHFPETLGSISQERILEMTQAIFADRFTTFSAAWTVQALSAYGNAFSRSEHSLEEVILIDHAGQEVSTPMQPSPFPHLLPAYDTRAVRLKSDAPLFYLLQQSGFDRTLPEQPLAEGLEITRRYTDQDGNEVHDAPVGSNLTARLRVRSLTNRYVNQVAIMDLLPAGFEVDRASIQRQKSGWSSDYVDIREDRVLFFGTFGPAVETFTYSVRVTAPGTFVVPPVTAEAMYDRSLKAHTAAGHFTVHPPR
jgi:uncharacterized protein YfaS (alpha-2-macroglobulin family)